MDEPRTRKEVSSAEDRADPGEGGAWFFVRGADALRVVRGYLRGASIRDWLWLALAGVALWRFWFVPDYLRQIQSILGK
jgi:hypothetical protein